MLGIVGGQVGFVYPRSKPTIKATYSTNPNLPGERGTVNGVPVVLRYMDGVVNKYEAVFKFTFDYGPANGGAVTTYYAGFNFEYASVKAVMEGVVETLRWYSGGLQVGQDFLW